MEQIIRLETISQFNVLKGVKTRHPLVSVFNYDDAKNPILPNGKYHYGFYAIFLKETKCGMLTYGRKNYDYEEGTLVFVGPGQILGIQNDENYQAKGLTLIFHPDFIKGTTLAKKMNSYSFFSYELNEALHLSEKERQIIIDLFSKVDYELDQSIDKHSKTLITNNIELLLNYCVRFYDRQFITREHINVDILEQFEVLLNNYFESGKPQEIGLPSVKYFADNLHLSANYFGDLMKKETGKSALEHIHLKIIDIAKEKIFDTDKTVNEIAYELGFKYPQHFSRMFKKSTGFTPNEYRNQN